MGKHKRKSRQQRRRLDRIESDLCHIIRILEDITVTRMVPFESPTVSGCPEFKFELRRCDPDDRIEP